jgi:hypothetical protein
MSVGQWRTHRPAQIDPGGAPKLILYLLKDSGWRMARESSSSE